MDCSTHIYHQNKFGNTRKCTCHDAIHLTFGNISLLLTRVQLTEFADYVHETISMQCCIEDPDERCIHIPTRDFALMFALSFRELKQLARLLDKTLVMFQVEDVLSPKSS